MTINGRFPSARVAIARAILAGKPLDITLGRKLRTSLHAVAQRIGLQRDHAAHWVRYIIDDNAERWAIQELEAARKRTYHRAERTRRRNRDRKMASKIMRGAA